jgi:hypothetical protein
MSKPIMRFISTTSEKLDSIAIVAGQLIFVSDTRVIYLDTDKRTTYQAIINVTDESTRQNLQSPVEGFYYVRKENTLWSYFNETWAQITGKDSSLVFADGNLPSEGIKDNLYVNGTKIYRWDDTTQSYITVGGASLDWEDITE